MTLRAGRAIQRGRFSAASTVCLSVRTFVYGYAGYLDNLGAKTVSLNSFDPSQPGGMSQTGVQLGINHSF